MQGILGPISLLISQYRNGSQNVFTYGSCNPLARMDCGVEVDGGLHPLATFAPEVNTVDISALVRFSGDEYFRVGRDCSMEVLEESTVIRIVVVGVEP